jgi:hypothetical protein
MIHRKKRLVSTRRKILDSFSPKIRKALKCDPRLITCIESIKRKTEELVTIERYKFLENPSKVPNIKRISDLSNQGYDHNQIAEILKNEGAVSGEMRILSKA